MDAVRDRRATMGRPVALHRSPAIASKEGRTMSESRVPRKDLRKIRRVSSADARLLAEAGDAVLLVTRALYCA